MNDIKTSVAAEVAALPGLSIGDLWKLWDRYFPRRPRHPNRAFIESRIAYKLQEQAFGGLSSTTRLRLEAIGAKYSKIRMRASSRDFHFAPGTLLVREWREREHQVMVTAEGSFEYEGRHFRSLSAVARHITGTPWSGPLFFGLTGKGAQS